MPRDREEERFDRVGSGLVEKREREIERSEAKAEASARKLKDILARVHKEHFEELQRGFKRDVEQGPDQVLIDRLKRMGDSGISTDNFEGDPTGFEENRYWEEDDF